MPDPDAPEFLLPVDTDTSKIADKVPPGVEPIDQEALPEGTVTAEGDA